MTAKMTVMRPDGSGGVSMVELSDQPTYAELCQQIEPFLDGGTLEQVNVLHDGRRADMFVDGDGVERKLPRNEAATVIYRAWSMSKTPEQDPESLPAIYGPAILFDRIVWT